MSGSDSESTEEPVIGNVSKFAVFPPMYSGEQKQGHLVFDACFEEGNLGRVDYITEFEYDLFIRPDTCNPKYRVWFNFTVENTLPDQKVIFNIVNFSKTKSLYREGMTPLIKSSSRPQWLSKIGAGANMFNVVMTTFFRIRMPSKNVYYYRSPDHRKNYVLSFAFCFDKADDVYQFAYCYPYSYSRLQNYLDNVDRKSLSYFNRELLCLSVQQRRLDLVTITNPETNGVIKKKTVFVTSRVHPGETPSSYICQGFMDFLLSRHPMAKMLRDHVVFRVIPMLNPDGVYLGNYRASLMGFDLNRHWNEPSPWAHPTLYATKKILAQLECDQASDMEFYIDLHAHTTLMNGFMYGNIFDDPDRFERQSLFPRLFAENSEDFSLTNTQFNRDMIKAGTGRRTFGGSLDEYCYSYTLEVSFFGYVTSSSSTPWPYSEEAYMRLGRNFARTFFDYFKLTGHVDINRLPGTGVGGLKEAKKHALD